MEINFLTKRATIYTAIFFMVIFLIGIVFFRKDDNNIEENTLELDNQQLVEAIKNKEVTEKEKTKATAENFAIIYYSYAWGNFSNIESQYYYMTDEMKNREKSRVEEMREGTKNQPQKYFTARAKLADSNFVIYEKASAVLKIDLNIDNYAGAIVQRDTMVWVDESGNYYGGDTKDLMVNAIDKNVEINLVKIGEEWKVDKIEEVER